MLDVKALLTKILNRIGLFDTDGTVVYLAVNTSGNPYLRWTKDGTKYQIRITTTGIAYEKQVGSGSWTTVWSNH